MRSLEGGEGRLCPPQDQLPDHRGTLRVTDLTSSGERVEAPRGSEALPQVLLAVQGHAARLERRPAQNSPGCCWSCFLWDHPLEALLESFSEEERLRGMLSLDLDDHAGTL